jgi:hypothetical protein
VISLAVSRHNTPEANHGVLTCEENNGTAQSVDQESGQAAVRPSWIDFISARQLYAWAIFDGPQQDHHLRIYAAEFAEEGVVHPSWSGLKRVDNWIIGDSTPAYLDAFIVRSCQFRLILTREGSRTRVVLPEVC